jgi:hypothetical protein
MLSRGLYTVDATAARYLRCTTAIYASAVECRVYLAAHQWLFAHNGMDTADRVDCVGNGIARIGRFLLTLIRLFPFPDDSNPGRLAARAIGAEAWDEGMPDGRGGGV